MMHTFRFVRTRTGTAEVTFSKGVTSNFKFNILRRKIITTPDADFDQHKMMFELLGLRPRESFKESATAAEAGFVEEALIR